VACFMETSRKRGIEQQYCMVWFVRYVPRCCGSAFLRLYGCTHQQDNNN
jgi:hypothetical protein